MAEEPKHSDTYIADYKEGRERGELGPAPPDKMEDHIGFDDGFPWPTNVNAGAQRRWAGAYHGPLPTVSGSNARFAEGYDRIFGAKKEES